jgi:PAS domain S-box-containing protein
MAADRVPGDVPDEIAARVLDAVDALVVVLDPKGRVAVWNRACEEVTGQLAASAIGRKLWLLSNADADVLRAGIEDCRRGRGATTFEARWKDGRSSRSAPTTAARR